MLRFNVAVSCGVGHRCGSDPVLLWLWCKPMAIAPIHPLAWEPPKKKTHTHTHTHTHRSCLSCQKPPGAIQGVPWKTEPSEQGSGIPLPQDSLACFLLPILGLWLQEHPTLTPCPGADEMVWSPHHHHHPPPPTHTAGPSSLAGLPACLSRTTMPFPLESGTLCPPPSLLFSKESGPVESVKH